jgi:Tfp pilus assembly protein FimT
MIVIGIIGILAGVTIMRMGNLKLRDELDASAELLQSTFVEVREKAQSPQTDSGVALNQKTDINGYGVEFSNTNNRQFIFFKDKVLSTTLNNYDSDGTDTVIRTYSFNERGMDTVTVDGFIDEDSNANILLDSSKNFIFTSSEIPSQRKIYFDGVVPSYTSVSVVLRNSAGTRRVTLNLKTGEVKVQQ